MANIFGLAKKFTDAFFDGLKRNMEEKVIDRAEKAGIERRAIEKRKQEKRDKDELEQILGSIPEPGISRGKSTTVQIMELLINYVESNGKTEAPIIDDFVNLNKNEDLNIRIRHFSDTGKGFISDYRTALLNAGAEELKNPADIERVINNFVEPDAEEKLNNAQGNHNLEQVAEYIQNNINNLSKNFLPAAKLAALNQSIDTSLIQRNLKIGYSSAGEVLKQLEASGIISKNLEDIEYSIHLEGLEKFKAMLLLLEDDVQNKLMKQLKKE